MFRACGAKDGSSEIPGPARLGRDLLGAGFVENAPRWAGFVGNPAHLGRTLRTMLRGEGLF